MYSYELLTVLLYRQEFLTSIRYNLLQIHRVSAMYDSVLYFNISQGIVDGSQSKPALRQDIGYMVEKTYHIAPYLGAFGAYLMPL